MLVKDMRTGQIILVDDDAKLINMTPIQFEEEVDEDDFLAY